MVLIVDFYFCNLDSSNTSLGGKTKLELAFGPLSGSLLEEREEDVPAAAGEGIQSARIPERQLQ
jgi:hypothetical protein